MTGVNGEIPLQQGEPLQRSLNLCPAAADVGASAGTGKEGITAEQIAHTIHAHPAMYEGIAEAAEQALGCAIHA